MTENFQWHIVRRVVVPMASALVGVLVDAALLHRAVGDALVQLLRAVAGQ